MKKLIRTGVFETNSSSSHSISLAGEDRQFVLDTIYPDDDGLIVLTGGDFGWEWFKHNDARTKANYAAQDLNNHEILIKVIKEQTGATKVVIIADGYIDHDSQGTAPRTEEGLRDFIFNKNSWLFGGNDNQTADPTFYHFPEIRDGEEILPNYKYELIIDGLGTTTKFLKNPAKEQIEQGISALLSSKIMDNEGEFLNKYGDLFWQTNRSKDYFEKSIYIEQQYSKGYILMTKENSYYVFEKELEENGIIKKDMNWMEKSKVLNKEYLKRKDLSRKVKFTLKEI